MKKTLFLLLLIFLNSGCAQNKINPVSEAVSIKKFPKDIVNYQKLEDSILGNSNKTYLQLVLFNRKKLEQLSLNNDDLVNDAEELNVKVNDYFKNLLVEKAPSKKNKKGRIVNKKVVVEKELSKGYLLITKYFFLGKNKPYQLNEKDNIDNEDLQIQIAKEAQCNKGVCINHIIMGINYFDENLKIKPLDIQDFSNKLYSKEEIQIHSNYDKSKEGILKIYYFYGVNGLILPIDKPSIKKIIEESQR